MECKFCDSYTGICMNSKSPMCGDDCPVPDTEGLCKHEVREEEICKLTPKGCAAAALMKANLINSTSDPAIDVFWEEFSLLMEKCEYVKEES